MLLGISFGLFANQLGLAQWVSNYIKPFGTLFIRLISMVVVLLVFASLLIGTTSLNDLRKLGRIGGKAAGYYLCTTAIAITIGLVLANTVKPGAGLSADAKSKLMQQNQASAGQKIQRAMDKPKISDTLLNIVPKNPLRAFTEGNMLQIIFFAIMLGLALNIMPAEKGQAVIKFFSGMNDAMIQMVHLIMKVAPYGVFALLAGVTAEFGITILLLLLKYTLVVFVGLMLHVVFTYGLAVRFLSKVNVLSFLKGIRSAQIIAFSSSSSLATLPVTMECAEENLGVSKEVSSFVLPLGATINMDGTALYQGVATVFIAQVFGIELTLGNQLTIVLMATLASIGAVGVPGVGLDNPGHGVKNDWDSP